MAYSPPRITTTAHSLIDVQRSSSLYVNASDSPPRVRKRSLETKFLCLAATADRIAKDRGLHSKESDGKAENPSPRKMARIESSQLKASNQTYTGLFPDIITKVPATPQKQRPISRRQLDSFNEMPTGRASPTSIFPSSEIQSPPRTPKKFTRPHLQVPFNIDSSNEGAVFKDLSPLLRYQSSNSASISPQPPPTPRRRITNCELNPYRDLSVMASKGSMLIKQQEISMQVLGCGTYMNAYTVTSDQPICKGISNQQLVLKLYNDERSAYRTHTLSAYLQASISNYKSLVGLLLKIYNQDVSHPPSEKPTDYLEASIENYRYLIEEIKLPVAIIYNLGTAEKDHYFLQERVPQTINVFDDGQQQQARQFFLASLNNDLVLDLKPDNLFVRSDGTVVLIDFTENPEDGVKLYIRHAVTQWCRSWKRAECDKELVTKKLEAFTAGFDKTKCGYDLTQNAEIIDSLFMEVSVQV